MDLQIPTRQFLRMLRKTFSSVSAQVLEIIQRFLCVFFTERLLKFDAIEYLTSKLLNLSNINDENCSKNNDPLELSWFEMTTLLVSRLELDYD